VSTPEPSQSVLPSIAIIGAGAMGGAILSGLVQPGVTVRGGIRVTNRTAAKADAVAASHAHVDGVDSLALERDAEANRVAVRGAGIVLIGVKPAMVPDTLRELADALEPDAVVISLAAGVTIATMEAIVPNAVLRSMPNTPAVVGRAVTGLAPGTRSTAADLALGRAVFETVGTVVDIEESQVDPLGTISGSGPAWVYFFLERITETAIHLGFTPSQAKVMVQETWFGSMEYLIASGRSPEELRREVTSPKGTTERAIGVLIDADLTALFVRAVEAGLVRAREMAAGG
jgi:pyrroline-5-carboxylate reductase